MSSETYTAYEYKGVRVEIDHLGICHPDQWGCFAVYIGSDQVAEFAIAESMLRPEFRPSRLPVSEDELIDLATTAIEAQAVTS